ncbi:MAG TPA: hypothetical protein VNX86_04060 [Rhizomicrobium sp.]|nr:hypothetical protein [Rhizomicrobium sp.]
MSIIWSLMLGAVVAWAWSLGEFLYRPESGYHTSTWGIGAGVIVFAYLLYVSYEARHRPNTLELRMLESRLKVLGIEPGSFSAKCLTELVHIGTDFEKNLVSRKEYLRRLPSSIVGIATNVQWICLGEDKDHTVEGIRALAECGMPNVFWEVLAKHDPKRFALDQLEKTQASNRMLRSLRDSN